MKGCLLPGQGKATLFLSQGDLLFTQTIKINGQDLRVFNGPIPPHWQAAAEEKGLRLLARVEDHQHVAVECVLCNGTFKVRISVVRSNAPICPHCQETGWAATAKQAGLAFLSRDNDTHYGNYLLPCGHTAVRQRGFIAQVARGEKRVCCKTCLQNRDAIEARHRGWELLGPDPDGKADYRLYKHDCGHHQRVARANIKTGRVDCGACGVSWAAAPNNLYVMRFRLPSNERVIKLGHSGDPRSRMIHQLRRDRTVEGELLRVVPVVSGRKALSLEKKLHRQLRHLFPEKVLPREVFEDALRVGSEVYAQSLEPALLALIDALSSDISGGTP